jgi:anti-sigma factor RsiW
MMDHDALRQMLPAYVDDELGMAETLVMEQHLAGCADCQRDCANQRSVKTLLRKHAAYEQAPAHLAATIFPALQTGKSAAGRLRPRGIGWFNTGLAAASLCLAAAGGGYYLGLAAHARPLTQEIVANHIRSLQADHLVDIASSDQHTVKPWFSGKLDFSPSVTDFATEGFPLAGGRLDYLDGHPVAALVYRRNGHPINLYAWPSDSADVPPGIVDERGYHLLQWTTDRMHYCVISDLAPDELRAFAAAFRAKVSKAAAARP